MSPGKTLSLVSLTAPSEQASSRSQGLHAAGMSLGTAEGGILVTAQWAPWDTVGPTKKAPLDV